MMRIKSYFVSSAGDAMAQARAELGDDALLLSTRRNGPGYEVVFGAGGAEEPAQPEQAKQEPQNQQQPQNQPSELARIREEIEGIRELLVSPERNYPAEIRAAFSRLLEAGFDPRLAAQIADALEPGAGFVAKLRAEIAARVPIESSLGAHGYNGTVVALVGPGGAGKTTTLMKIAAFQVAPERPVRMFALDQSSLAARMQLQLFARKTGITFTPVEAPEKLPEMVAQACEEEIVLIDTPGCAEEGARERLASILNACPGADVHMTAPAHMSAEALRRAISKYSIFRPAKLIVTKLDEWPLFGGAISEAVRAKLSISLLTNGTAIARDLHAASIDDVVALALGSGARAACA
jgi:flagellar biosynthesis protein FlhF